MSIARRALERKAANTPFDFAARREQLLAATAAAALVYGDPIDGAPIDGAAIGEAPVAPPPHRPSPAQASAARKAAAALAADQAAILDGSADLTPYDNQLVALYGDIKRLKSIMATDKKIELKREILPNYLPWVLGRLDAAASGQRGGQDDVLVQVMIWAIDTGDYKLGLELAEYARRYSPKLPDRFKRDLANTVTEEIADAALKAYRAGGEEAARFPGGVLGDVEELFRDDDMFDVVQGKLQKAIGQAILQSIDEASDPTTKLPIWKDALTFFKRAQAKDSASGCVKLIEKLERDIAKHAPE